MKNKIRIILAGFAVSSAAVIGCSGGDAPEGTGGTAAAPLPQPTATPAAQAFGGAVGTDDDQWSELFSNGSRSGVDTSDPCNAKPLWKSDSAIALTTGTQVIYEGQIWEITGAGVDTDWAMEICAPPGVEWCAEEYAWEAVQACE